MRTHIPVCRGAAAAPLKRSDSIAIFLDFYFACAIIIYRKEAAPMTLLDYIIIAYFFIPFEKYPSIIKDFELYLILMR
jgi:hypothetical protein